jgi:SSS family solute:Na+ symporter
MSRNLWQATWGWVVCFVLTGALSFVTRPKTDEELKGLVKGLTPAADEKAVPLLGRPAFWAAISVVVLIALNLYFW